MTPDDIASRLRALDNEFRAGNIGFGQYHSVAQKLFDYALAMAENCATFAAQNAALTARVAALETKSQPKDT